MSTGATRKYLDSLLNKLNRVFGSKVVPPDASGRFSTIGEYDEKAARSALDSSTSAYIPLDFDVWIQEWRKPIFLFVENKILAPILKEKMEEIKRTDRALFDKASKNHSVKEKIKKEVLNSTVYHWENLCYSGYINGIKKTYRPKAQEVIYTSPGKLRAVLHTILENKQEYLDKAKGSQFTGASATIFITNTTSYTDGSLQGIFIVAFSGTSYNSYDRAKKLLDAGQSGMYAAMRKEAMRINEKLSAVTEPSYLESLTSVESFAPNVLHTAFNAGNSGLEGTAVSIRSMDALATILEETISEISRNKEIEDNFRSSKSFTPQIQSAWASTAATFRQRVKTAIQAHENQGNALLALEFTKDVSTALNSTKGTKFEGELAATVIYRSGTRDKNLSFNRIESSQGLVQAILNDLKNVVMDLEGSPSFKKMLEQTLVNAARGKPYKHKSKTRVVSPLITSKTKSTKIAAPTKPTKKVSPVKIIKPKAGKMPSTGVTAKSKVPLRDTWVNLHL